MEKSIEKLESSRSPIEEREKHFSVSAQAKWLRKKRETLGRKRKDINTPAPNSHLSHGSASLQVWQCRTRQDCKGKSKVLAVLAAKLRIYV